MFQEKILRITVFKMLVIVGGFFRMLTCYQDDPKAGNNICLTSKMIEWIKKNYSAPLNIYTRYVPNEIHFKCLFWCHWPE